MNFLSKKILKFQQKKLDESEKTLQIHLDKKKKLVFSGALKREIEHEEKLIKIWSTNIKKIKNEMKKIQ